MESKRIEWIDVSRGLAILLVVLGHCIGNVDNPGNKFILSFHMPLFFFISGLCVKEYQDKFSYFFFKKVKSLLIPQITLGIINLDYGKIIEKQNGGVKNFLGWFLLVLFYVTIIFFFLQKIINKNKYIKFIVFALDLIFIVVLSQIKITTMLHFEIVPMALLFYMIGYLINPFLLNSNDKDNKWQGIWILAIPILAISSYWNSSVLMYDNNYGNLVLFFIGAFSGIVIIYHISKRLNDNKFLAWFGKNSIIVYVLHFKMINVLHFVGIKMIPQISKSNYLYPAYWHYYLLMILLLIPIVFVCDKWFGFFFGKFKKKEKQ